MTTGKELGRPVEILLVEDSPSDAGLTMTALEKVTVSNKVTHVEDGVDAISLLRNEGVYADAVRPDVILLDIICLARMVWRSCRTCVRMPA